MNALRAWTKDPDAKLDYTIDWGPYLGTDTISASVWTVPAGITQASPAPSNTTTKTTIWLSGGSDGEDYLVANKITTTGGRIDERTLFIQVRQR